MPNLPQNIAFLITSVIAVISLILYGREYFLRKNASKSQQQISTDTRQKSMELLKAAQMAETQVLAEGDYVTKKLLAHFQSELEKLVKDSENTITSSQDKLISFMGDLQKRSQEFEQSSKVSIEQRINNLFTRLEEKLSDFLIQTEQKTTSSIDLELKSTRSLIEAYKNQQIKLIDENIIAMLEKTLSIILAKKLSLKDQLDLVYESLEKAKAEKFIV